MFEQILSQPKFLQKVEIIAKNLTRGTSVSWEDAFQTALIKVLHAIRANKFPNKMEEFYNWAVTVARNAIRDMMRIERRRNSQSLDKTLTETGLSMLDSIPDEFNFVNAQERKDLLTQAIKAIKNLNKIHPERSYLKLCQGLAQDKTQKEIATELGVSQGEVSKRRKEIARLIFQELGLLRVENIKQEQQMLRNQKSKRKRSDEQW